MASNLIERDILDIIELIKDELSLTKSGRITDKMVAEALGLSQQAFAQIKHRRTISYQLINKFFVGKHNLETIYFKEVKNETENRRTISFN